MFLTGCSQQGEILWVSEQIHVMQHVNTIHFDLQINLQIHFDLKIHFWICRLGWLLETHGVSTIFWICKFIIEFADSFRICKSNCKLSFEFADSPKPLLPRASSRLRHWGRFEFQAAGLSRACLHADFYSSDGPNHEMCIVAARTIEPPCRSLCIFAGSRRWGHLYFF